MSHATPPAQLSQINVFPIKSIAGLSQSQAWVEKQGICFDRRFMVANLNGRMITARQYPQLVKVAAALHPHGLVLTHPDCAPLILRYADFSLQPANATVWNDTFSALQTTEAANHWFSTILNETVQLLFTGEQSQRVRPKIQQNVSFADGYPLLVISEASLEALNARSPQQHTMAQFRTNLVVTGTEAFAEDGWKRIRIGEVTFEIVKPCARCVLTTVDPKTGTFNPHKEPLQTLTTFRADANGNVFFGQNLVALNEGMIRAGDTVEVLEIQTPAHYPDRAMKTEAATREAAREAAQEATHQETSPQKAIPQETSRPATPVIIRIDGEQFTGDNQSSLLEQAEAAGFTLAHRCRAGLCGACKITLTAGTVDQPDMPALRPDDREAGKVLACCCIPQSDVVLQR
ncbi:YcbX family protein [Photobacterium japonica]|uniref:YcbX family protein n=1 Tax=Photobacterium japonica TaxID=2910235 RepID=UPI003D123A3A